MDKIISKRDILNRIKELYDLQNNADLARFLEVAPTTIASWYSRNSINYDLIFAKCEQADLNWLIRGSSEKQEINNCQRDNFLSQDHYQIQLRTIAKDIFGELEQLIEKSSSNKSNR